MTDQAYQLFLDSMVLDFDKWHDGIGYDLQALGRLGPEDQLSIEKLLIENLRQAGDWRDVEALASLPTPSAQAAVAESRNHSIPAVRNYAIRTLLRHPHAAIEAELEGLVIQAVAQGHYDMAESMPTPAVKAALLESARQPECISRPHAAALLLYLCGQADEPYDWSQRPFFLRFASADRELRETAWRELRDRVNL